MAKLQEEFGAITSRLKLVLELESDAELAEKLGHTSQSWSKRKARDSLPTKDIDALIAREELNPEFIYKGIGNVHIPVDGQAWETGFLRKLGSLFGIETYVRALVSNGYDAQELKAVAAGTSPAPATLLRDLHTQLHVDLHALLCDAAPISQAEIALLERYRSAPEEGRRLIEQAASFAARPSSAKS